MEDKELNNTIPVIDSELNAIISRLDILKTNLNIGVYGSYDTENKDETKENLIPSLRTLADKAIDINHLLNSLEPLCNKIRESETPVKASSN